MPRKLCWPGIWGLAVIPLQVTAIQLDCQDNGDGTYFCVEIDPVRDAAENSSALSEAVERNNPYIEEAKKECTYKPPRRHGNASGSRAALFKEREKSAKQDYEYCLASKAHEIKKAQQQ